MSQTEAKKVYSFMYYFTNQDSGGQLFFTGSAAGVSGRYGYIAVWKFISIDITDSWFVPIGTTNPGTVTYRIIKAA